MLIVPKASAREKKRASFKTISFLESIPENEQGTGFSDHQGGKMWVIMHMERIPREDGYTMGSIEEYSSSRKNPRFLHDGNTFPAGMCTGDVTFITVPCLSAGEKIVPASPLPGNGCEEVLQKSERLCYLSRQICLVFPGKSAP